MAAARQSAWTILDGKRINHALIKHGLLDYPASHSQIAFSLTCHSANAFTVKVGQPQGGNRLRQGCRAGGEGGGRARGGVCQRIGGGCIVGKLRGLGSRGTVMFS